MSAYIIDNEDLLKFEINKYNEPKKILSYGTAGFRDRSDLPLNYIYFRMGIFSNLRALSLSTSTTNYYDIIPFIGVMITASHNLEIDNGLKLVDYDGSMLSYKWEPYAMKLANCLNDKFIEEYKKIIELENIDINQLNQHNNIIIVGYDTRSHSIEFLKNLEHGISVSNGKILNLGEVITPIVHFVVRRLNELSINSNEFILNESVSTKWINDYYHTLSTGFIELLATTTRTNDNNSIATIIDVAIECNLILDASYGVGSITVEQFLHYYNNDFINQYYLDNSKSSTSSIAINANMLPKIAIDIRNKAYEGKVNEGCGAEHVQKLQIPPINIHREKDQEKLVCSFDGDGDRLVFHAYINNQWYLYDGDKIAVLFAIFLKQELEITGLLDKFTFGIIQTAYANGGSTNYLKLLNIPIYYTKTGVKYLHHKAIEFDISIYFEANGHGTIIFSNKFKELLKKQYEYISIDDDNNNNDHDRRILLGYQRLLACTKLINPAIGDALSDMLLSIAILKVLNIDIYGWNDIYQDLPSKQEKVIIPNKDLIKCNDDETKVIHPIEFQLELDIYMKNIQNGRCFIRPSGTEDIVRIYAEASTMEGVDELIMFTTSLIKKYFDSN